MHALIRSLRLPTAISYQIAPKITSIFWCFVRLVPAKPVKHRSFPQSDCIITLAPIFISFTWSVLSDQSLIFFGRAKRLRKLPRLGEIKGGESKGVRCMFLGEGDEIGAKYYRLREMCMQLGWCAMHTLDRQDGLKPILR